MDPKTEVMRTPDGSRTYLHHEMRFCLDESDIVAGNRYVDGRHGLGLVPDPAGYLVALITHRGENAPPRPATLPVGTRVRRGPDWCWEDQDGTPGNVGTVDGADGADGWVSVDWGGGSEWLYRWGGGAKGNFYDLEVVSLPAEKPAKPAPKTWPDEAVLVDDTDTDGQRRWFDALGNHHCKAGAPKLVEPAAATLRRSFLTRGIRYDIAAVDQAKEDPKGWLCVRDFTGKDWHPSGVADKTAATTTPAFKVGDWVRLRDDVAPAMLAEACIYGAGIPIPGEPGCVTRIASEALPNIGVKFLNQTWYVRPEWIYAVEPGWTIPTGTLKPGDIVSISTEGVAVEHAPTTLPRHHRVMLERLRAAGWVVTDSENTDVAEAGMATRSDTRILITPDAIRVVAKKPACTGTVGVSLDYACEQAAAVLEAAAIIDTVRSEWALASEHGAVPPVTPEPARRIIPVEGFHDMEHLLEDAEPAGIVPRPSR